MFGNTTSKGKNYFIVHFLYKKIAPFTRKHYRQNTERHCKCINACFVLLIKVSDLIVVIMLYSKYL